MAETEKTRRHRQKRPPLGWIYYVAMALCLALFFFAGYKVISILTEYREGQKTYEDLSQYISLPQNTSAPADTSQDAASDVSDPVIHAPSGDTSGLTDWDAMDQNADGESLAIVNFDALLSINEDVAGWIYFPNIDINYPVVQGASNNTYLYRTVNKKSNGSGSIFMDFRNQRDMSDPHTILYGHHMNDGTMFAPLLGYRKQEFYDENPTFQYITPDAHYEVEIISAHVASVEQNAWKLTFDTEEEKAKWVASVLRRSNFKCDYEYQEGDQYMTLSTCTYDFENARYVVTGVLRKVSDN